MNPLINLLHLKFFCDAVIHKSISQAAKINFVTQSAVSQGILKLERIIGSELLIHSRQNFQLTKEGKIVFENANNIFKAVQETFDRVNESKQAVKIEVKFVCTKSLGLSYIPSAYQRTIQNIPLLDIQFKMGGLDFIRESLLQEMAEFAVVVYDESFAAFEKKPLRKGNFHLFHAKHTPENLIQKGLLIDYQDGMYVKEMRELGFLIQAELSGWEDVARFTEVGMGVGLLPDYIVSGNRYSTLKIYPQAIPHFEYEICAIYKKGASLSRGAYAFLDQLN